VGAGYQYVPLSMMQYVRPATTSNDVYGDGGYVIKLQATWANDPREPVHADIAVAYGSSVVVSTIRAADVGVNRYHTVR